MKFEMKSFADAEIAVAATMVINREQIKERKVICKACAHEFTITEIIKHNTDDRRGYCHCPACNQINDVKKTLTCGYIEEQGRKREVAELNDMVARLGRRTEQDDDDDDTNDTL